MSVLEIQRMPRQEQLKLMEILWAELSRNEAELESPAWHADALHETSARRARGEETTLDWEQAKAKLRQSCAPKRSIYVQNRPNNGLDPFSR